MENTGRMSVVFGEASGRKGKATGRGSISAAAPFSTGRRSGPAAGLYPVGRGSGLASPLFPMSSSNGTTAASSPSAAAMAPGLYPVEHGSSPASPLFSINIGNGSASGSSPSAMAAGSAESSLIGGFSSHSGGGFTRTSSSPPTEFPFPSSPSPAWDKGTFVPGGFMSYFGNQAHNFHLVGGATSANGGSSPSEVEIISEQGPVLVNDENENVRTDKRILWTPKEDESLMSAWIENSTDSTNGADRKGEAYWGDVIKAYNKNTPPQRKRNAKQAKDRWHKINRWCDLFESDYLKARRVFTSGYNDQMWMDATENFYLDHKLEPFVIKNVWKICREVPKWKTYNEELKNARKRKSYRLEEDVENVKVKMRCQSDQLDKRQLKRPLLLQKASRRKWVMMENQRDLQLMWKRLINLGRSKKMLMQSA